MLRWVLPAGPDGETIVGDLHEEFAGIASRSGSVRADVWYWRQVISTGFAYSRPGRAALERRLQDLRFSFRAIRKEPGFSGAIVLTLALAIGAGTAIFSVVDGVLLRPLPFERPEELVRIWASNEEAGQRYLDLLYTDIGAFSEGTSSFSGMSGLSLAPNAMLDARGDNAENVIVARTSPTLFATLGVTPVLGRAYTAEDASRGESYVLISHGLWQRRFGGDADVVGTFVHLDSRGYEIIGVLGEGLEYPERAQVWRALAPAAQLDDDREVHLVARLRSDARMSVANAEVQSVALGLAEQNPDSHGGLSAWLQPLQAMVVRDVRSALYALLGAVALLLLIACVNTANLLLARAARRRHEVAIRTALGASQARIVSLHLTESLVLALLGGLGGLLVGRWLLTWMMSITPHIPRLDMVALDLRIVAIMGFVTAVAGVVFGVGPALHAAAAPPEGTLRDGGHGTTISGRRMSIQSGLVTTEIALSTVLAVLAVLMFSTFRTAITYDRGFDFENLMAVEIDPLHPPAPGDATRTYFRSIVEGVKAIPEVRYAALSSHEILEQRGMRLDLEIEGRQRSDGHPPQATVRTVSHDFFQTAGIPVTQGRTFAEDGGASDDVDLVVNQRFVELHLGGTGGGPDPLGLRVDLDWDTRYREISRGRIVGVVGDVSPNLGELAQPMVYVPFAQLTLPGMWLVVRTIGEPASAMPGIRSAVESVDRTVLIERVDVLEQTVQTSVAPERFNMLLVVTFAVLALTLAAVGIYGVTAFSVTARRGEIGIRRALGASDQRIAAEVARRVAGLTAIGVVAGVVASSAGGRLLSTLVVGVQATDFWVVGSVGILLAAVSAIAAVIPILRATRIEPTEALGTE